MSISKSALDDFIAAVPGCLQTTRLSVVLEIFSQAVRSLSGSGEQQCPIGAVPALML